MSHPDLREPFYVSIWFGQGVIWVGILCVVFLCVWPSVVPNQRQLSIVVSDWESYLGSLFPPPRLWDLVLVLLLLSPTRLYVSLVRAFLFF